jgi:integrase
LSDPLLEALLEYRERSAFTRPDDFVFCRQDGSPADPEFLRLSVLYPVLDEVGIKRLPRKHGFHLFRHSAATIVHSATGSVKLAQRQLRHATASITSDVYIHPDDEETRRTGQALAEAIAPKLAHLGTVTEETIH